MDEAVKSFARTYLKNMDKGKYPGNLHQLILKEMEVALFEKILEYTNGYETRTAKILNISRNTFRTKCKEYGINRRDFKWPKHRPFE